VLASGGGDVLNLEGKLGGQMDCNLDESQMKNVSTLVMEINTGAKMP